MAQVSATVTLEAELAGAGGGWTDISADVNLRAEAVVAEYGVRGYHPDDRVADTGTLTFALNNSDRNSGGLQGYYSPGHTNARGGWDIGIAIRLLLTYSGTTYYKFHGTLVEVVPEGGINRRQFARCEVVDWIDEAARTKIRDVAVQANKRSDEVAQELVENSVTRQPVSATYNTGQSTWALSLDNVREESTTVLGALAGVTFAEVGFLYVKGNTSAGGELVFESRHTRPLFGAALTTIDDTMYTIVAPRTRDCIINHAIVIAHPRRVDTDAETVLFALTSTDTVPEVPAGESLTIIGLFREETGRFVRVGGKDLVTPVEGTDYIANSQADGGGTDLSSQVTVTVTARANTGVFTLTNNAAVPAFFTTLQVRGNAIQDTYETAVESSDAASQTSYGEIDLTYDMVYEESLVTAKGVAEWFVGVYANPRTCLEAIGIHANTSDALMTAALAREIGDKVTLTETVTGVDGDDYFINAVRLTVKPGDLIDVEWTLTHADAQNFWILDQVGASELGVSTTLGFV